MLQDWKYIIVFLWWIGLNSSRYIEIWIMIFKGQKVQDTENTNFTVLVIIQPNIFSLYFLDPQRKAREYCKFTSFRRYVRTYVRTYGKNFFLSIGLLFFFRYMVQNTRKVTVRCFSQILLSILAILANFGHF